MAARCRSSKCTVERNGFKRELDTWRHKLINCVGFESILEGIYGPLLLRDLNIFDGECQCLLSTISSVVVQVTLVVFRCSDVAVNQPMVARHVMDCVMDL
uniref:Uncharacterized protein n=1 Tax=Oncorhynchus tshawytscha TaxID=74940 RepID=A0AAZ3P8S3_ONCTS